MKFKEYISDNEITEAFDKPYELTKSGRDYKFTVDDDKYVIRFNNKNMKTRTNKLAGVEFMFTKNHTTDISKSKEPFRVFATVAEALRQHNVSKYDYIEFSGSSEDRTRQKLYRKMRLRLQKELKWEYSEEDDQNTYIYQIIYKVKP